MEEKTIYSNRWQVTVGDVDAILQFTSKRPQLTPDGEKYNGNTPWEAVEAVNVFMVRSQLEELYITLKRIFTPEADIQ